MIAFLLQVLELSSGTVYTASFEPDLLHTRMRLSIGIFNRGWNTGRAVFGFHLAVLGYLPVRAGYMKKILGVLVILDETEKLKG